jgi:hypothetical protein
MEALTQQSFEAAQEFADAAIEALATERGIHAETAISGAARMAGTFLLRSFNLPLEGIEPGQPVLSDAANERGPRLVQALGWTLERLGVELGTDELNSAPGPDNQPLLTFLETQKHLEPRYAAIRDRWGLSLEAAAESAAVASALLIQRTVHVLDPSVAFQVAVYGFVEGTKTAPAPSTA